MSIKVVRRGFTLVELLVVIGIIALLISMLLPALNRAREQANLVACSSNLRTMGQMIQIYAAENNGFLPYGHAQMEGTDDPPGNATTFNKYTAGPMETEWDWPDTLTRLTNTATPGQGNYPLWVAQSGAYGPTTFTAANEVNMAVDYSGVFHDYDTSGLPYTARVSDYVCNPRVLADSTMVDMATGDSATTGTTVSTIHSLPIRSLGNIQHGAQVMMAWCGPQNLMDGQHVDWTWPFGPVADWIDDSAINWGGPPGGAGSNAYYLIYPVPPSNNYPKNTSKTNPGQGYNEPVMIGNFAVPAELTLRLRIQAKASSLHKSYKR